MYRANPSSGARPRHLLPQGEKEVEYVAERVMPSQCFSSGEQVARDMIAMRVKQWHYTLIPSSPVAEGGGAAGRRVRGLPV